MRYRELARQLTALGCREIPKKRNGFHRKWVNDNNGLTAMIPDWGSKDPKTGTVRAAIRYLGLPYPSRIRQALTFSRWAHPPRHSDGWTQSLPLHPLPNNPN